jgi:hypothetical protein
MNKCRASAEGGRESFSGKAAFHVVDRCPKTTPDPVAYPPTNFDTYLF